MGDHWDRSKTVIDCIVPLELSDRVSARPSLTYLVQQRIWPQLKTLLAAFQVSGEHMDAAGISGLFFGEDAREDARASALLRNFLPPLVPASQIRAWTARVAPQYRPFLEGLASANPGGMSAQALRRVVLPVVPGASRGDAALQKDYPRTRAGAAELRAALAAHRRDQGPYLAGTRDGKRTNGAQPRRDRHDLTTGFQTASVFLLALGSCAGGVAMVG